MTAGTGKEFRILIAAGGSGGHIFPALAVMDELKIKIPDLNVTWFGSSHRMESQLIPARGIDFVGLRTTEIRRKPSLTNIFYNIRSLWFLGLSIFSSIGHLRRLRPDLVLTTGGFAAGAMGLAACFTRTPLAIIEPNAYPGMTNRWLGQRATLVFTTYEDTVKFFPENKTHSLGTPARRELIEKDRDESRRNLGLDPDTIFIVAMGGSQGAAGINKNLPDAIKSVADSGEKRKIKVLHQCGRGKIDTVTPPGSIDYDVVEFIDDIPSILAAADIVVCRAGASTLTEIAILGLPAIIIPYPHSAENHQVKNAKAWESGGAGFCIEEKDLTLPILSEKISLLVSDKNLRIELGKSARNFGNPDSASKIASKLLDLIKNRVP